MNKHVKLIKGRTISEYTCNFNEHDLGILSRYDYEHFPLERYLTEKLQETSINCKLSAMDLCVDIQFDSDLDCTKFREKIEKSIGEYFKLALAESNY